jgi:hypothetical protein
VGPDPPPEDLKINEGDLSILISNDAPAKAKGKKDELITAPIEVPKSPEVLAAEKKIKKFANQFREMISGLQADLNLYRSIQTKITFRPLWPKQLTPQQI